MRRFKSVLFLSSDPNFARQGVAISLFLVVFIVSSATLIGYIRSVDALKSAVWLILISFLLLKILQSFRCGKKTSIFFIVWIVFFLFDVAVQGLLRGFFGANPSPSIIAESLANTTSGEVISFFTSQAKPILYGASYVTICITALLWLRGFYWFGLLKGVSTVPTWMFGLLFFATALLHFNPTMLRQQPLLRWLVIYARHVDSQIDIKAAQKMRSDIQASQAQWNITIKPGKQTVLIVIGESDNRNNWSWYGYQRATSKPLLDTLPQLGGVTTQWANARSPQAYTLPALRQALTPANSLHPELWRSTPDVFLLAKAAGYRITWLSNQVAHEGWLSLLGKSADNSKFVNIGNWRDSATTDFDLLPELSKQLVHSAPEKELIVLHLLGQHFHYDLRCPKELPLRPYTGVDDDTVMRQMKTQGRSTHIRQQRNEYDNAVFCGSHFLSKVLRELVANRHGRALDFVYFSDHGQDVGHTSNYAGHSNSSEQGFSVPLFHWTNRTTLRADSNVAIKTTRVIELPYSTEHMDHLIQGVLGVQSKWYDSKLDPLSKYR